jgi:glycyl-tRNA synthetase
MSEQAWGHGGLRGWGPYELMLREHAQERFVSAIRSTLLQLNSAWNFDRVEGPILMPRSFISPSYDGDDVWLLQAKLGEDEAVLRPETTAYSYEAAKTLLMRGDRKMPLCVWQVGKSFRREQSDGATAAKLRFYEFTQLEFQCLYSPRTLADYRSAVVEQMYNTIASLTHLSTRFVTSDRLPSYSTKTEDVEVEWNGRWTEMCSISDRTDYPDAKVLEVAIGLDRIVSCHG